MNRRRFLAVGSTVAVSGLTGCFGTSSDGETGPNNDDDLPADENPSDGYPPAFEETPDQRSIDTASFETVDRDGVDVPLAPIEAAYYWYARGEARFADARGGNAYNRSRIYGAVLSPAPDGGQDDPVAQWPETDRIVCYCGCPHHLSSLRAASLLSNGYENVYVIDEGFGEWYEREYPMAGNEVESRPELRSIEGKTDPEFSGESAWVRHEPSGQREATPITADGTYTLELRFADITDESLVVVRTPGYNLEASVGELTAGTVTGPKQS